MKTLQAYTRTVFLQDYSENKIEKGHVNIKDSESLPNSNRKGLKAKLLLLRNEGKVRDFHLPMSIGNC